MHRSRRQAARASRGQGGGFTVSPGGKLAVIAGTTVLEAKAPWTAWTTVPAPAGSFVHLLAYRGELLDMFSTDAILTWNGKRVWSGIPLRGGVLWGYVAGDDLSVVATSDGRIHVVGGEVAADLVLPSSPDEMVRIAAQQGRRAVRDDLRAGTLRVEPRRCRAAADHQRPPRLLRRRSPHRHQRQPASRLALARPR